MSHRRHAVAASMRPVRPMLRGLRCLAGLAAVLSVIQATSAEAQPSNPPPLPADYAGLAECKQFVPLARELTERIVDYISSPRPDFKCSDFGRAVWEGSKIYSIIRVANPKFCHEKYCYTVVYNERTNNIVFSIDAENAVDRFAHAADHVLSLKKILNHRFENTSNGLLVNTRDGVLAIAVVNEVLTISVVPPQKGGK